MTKRKLISWLSGFFAFFLTILVVGCSSEQMLLPENEVLADETPDLIVVDIQDYFLDFMEGFNIPTMAFTRQIHMFYTTKMRKEGLLVTD